MANSDRGSDNGSDGGSSSTSDGIPTARNVDHVGITVPDLEEAIAFFEDALGCETIYRATPPVDDSVQDWMHRNLGVHPESTMRLARLRCGPTTNVELLEYDDPTQTDEHPKNSDAGAAHLAFFVEDVDAAVAYLEDVDGVELQGEPRYNEEGPEEGQVFVYFRAPWGLQLELIFTPDDVGYTKSTDARAFGPAPEWDAEPSWSSE
ncbi:VOC family protein [Natronosalvus caseinilyticus]|uniref:VOC family protein n=1 Tax=Natronosalvus caseinilyticus TaxID=2953747 RepID=UPI0028A5B41C|nr:VOC family protein [Natronosalvus caseinilyticus]